MVDSTVRYLISNLCLRQHDKTVAGIAHLVANEVTCSLIYILNGLELLDPLNECDLPIKQMYPFTW